MAMARLWACGVCACVCVCVCACACACLGGSQLVRPGLAWPVWFGPVWSGLVRSGQSVASVCRSVCHAAPPRPTWGGWASEGKISRKGKPYELPEAGGRASRGKKGCCWLAGCPVDKEGRDKTRERACACDGACWLLQHGVMAVLYEEEQRR